ncbi:MAG: hypothetical protein ACOQNY_01400 [Mycoplasmoidaceae bacterium]
MMKRKARNTQPPIWFKDFAVKVETFIAEQAKFNKNIVKLNNLRTE